MAAYRKRDYKAEYAARKARDAKRGKQRDYKAEYQRNKTRATMAGFPSVKAFRKARPRARSVRIKRFTVDRDTQSIAWSLQHSRQAPTEYDESWTDEQKNEFFRTFVADFRKTEKPDVLNYLRQWYPELEKEEWEQMYAGD